MDLNNIVPGSSLIYSDYDLAHPDIQQSSHSAYPNPTLPFLDTFQTMDASNYTSIQTPDTEILNSLEHHLLSSDGSVVELSENSSVTTCFCSELLKVFETVQLGQTPGQPDQSKYRPGVAINSAITSLDGYNESLPFQKEVLKSCEKWLSQDASRIQSQHAMLIIEILEKLLTSIVSMTEASVHPNGGNIPSTPISPGKPTTSEKRRKRSAQDMQETGCLSQTKQWRLDDEERLHVLRSVLDFRVSRLKGLMERLAAITASNQWETHEVMMQNLLKRLNACGDSH